MRKLAAVLIGATLTVTALGGPAAAAAPVLTRLSVFLDPTPGLVGEDVEVVGKLQHRVGTRWLGLGNRPVRLSIAGNDGSERVYLDTVTTNADGTYTRTLRAPLSGAWRASFQPALGDDHTPSAKQTQWIDLRYRTRITGFSVRPGVAVTGSTLTVAGHADKLGVPRAFPLAGGRVELWWSRDGRAWSRRFEARTDGRGDFRFGPRADSDGFWMARLPAAGDYVEVDSSAARVEVKFRTRITGYAGGRRVVAAGSKRVVKGRLTRVYGSRARPLGGAAVHLLWSRDGRGWVRRIVRRTDRQGGFLFRPVDRADGYWTVRFPETDDDFGTGSPVTSVDVRLRTRVTVDGRPEPVRRGATLTITGVLRSVGPRGVQPMGGRLVRIFIRPAGSRPRLLGTATTNRNGGYVFRFRPLVAAAYRATWVGVGDYFGSASGWDFVGVRR